jgi:hypothetical protein
MSVGQPVPIDPLLSLQRLRAVLDDADSFTARMPTDNSSEIADAMFERYDTSE